MRKNVLVLILVVCTFLSGCSYWMDGSYHSVTPHLPEKVVSKQDTITIESTDQLLLALTQQIEQGSTNTVIYCTNAEEDQLKTAMDVAVESLSRSNGVFAYAVDELQYEIGQRNSQMSISVQVSYLHGKQELQKIRNASNMQDAMDLVADALDACDAGVVLRVKQYEKVDVTQFVQDYMDMNPNTCMEMPQVAVTLYPETGQDRIMELTFTYQTSRDALRNMQDAVQPVFSSAKNYVNADADQWEKYSQLYSFLMGRDNYTIRTSLTPSYSLLNHGVGDSKAFAVVYAAMCRQSDMECKVISGTRDGEPWCWNLIKVDGEDYHIDLLKCSQETGFSAKKDDEMSSYVWDYSAY